MESELSNLWADIADCCLIPESPFFLEGQGGLFEFVGQRLKENGHVVAEGAGQEYVAQSMPKADEKDASGNQLLLDIGLWLTQNIKDHFAKIWKMTINMKYIDPTYMVRAIPTNASDNIYCTLLAHSAVHGAMAGYTGFTVGSVNSRHAYIPIALLTMINTRRIPCFVFAIAIKLQVAKSYQSYRTGYQQVADKEQPVLDKLQARNHCRQGIIAYRHVRNLETIKLCN